MTGAVPARLLADLLAGLLVALPTTLALTALALLIGAALGSGLCAARLSRVPILRRGAAALILAVRLVPPLLWLLLVFHLLGSPHAAGAFAGAALGLGLIAAARLAEAGRHALSVVEAGQWEAVAALHLPARSVALEVLGPQLLRAAWPALAAEAVVLLRDSTLASLVGVGEIAAAAHEAVPRVPAGVAVLAAAALYLAMELPLAILARRAAPSLRAGAAR